MDREILAHVGGRIRLYRKSRGLTIEQLAAQVHKSKASMSKYESGHIALDIATLYAITQALGVSAAQLFDGAPGDRSRQAGDGIKSPFGVADRLYVYHMTNGKVHQSKLHLSTADGGISATLFYKLTGDGDGQCDCIYNGRMYYHDVVVAFVMQNYHNPVENILININIPLRRRSVLIGMICGLSGSTMSPTAYKVALSEQPLAADDALRGLLTLPADSFKDMKRRNILFIAAE
jgi:transcriptional regulator with XRE-family HTH domain